MTRYRLLTSAVALSFALGMCGLAVGQEEDEATYTPDEGPAQVQQIAPTTSTPQPAIFVPRGTVVTPASSLTRPEDAGLFAHTNYHIFVPAGGPMSSVTPYYTFAETPASLGCV